MAHRLHIVPKAQRQIKTLPKSLQDHIRSMAKSLADNPYPPGCKKLAGMQDLYRVRSGDYRIIYTVRNKELVVLVLSVGHRKDV